MIDLKINFGLTKCCLIYSILSILFYWFFDVLGNNDTLFFIPFVLVIVQVICFIILLFNIIYNFFKMKEKIKFIRCFIILIIPTVILLFVDLRFEKSKIDTYILENRRMKIIEAINPDNYKNGITEIDISKQQSFGSHINSLMLYKNNDSIAFGFYVFRGVLCGSVQIVYSKLDKDKLMEEIKYIVNIKEIKENWYYIETE